MDRTNRITGLLAYAAEISGVPLDAVRALGSDVAGTLPGGGAPVASTLNNDGSPLQVCLSARRGATAVRLLGDPGWRAGSSRERVADSIAACRALARRHAPRDLRSAIDAALAYGLSRDAAHLAAFEAGAIWLAASVGGRGLAAYVNVRWTDHDACWARSLAWLAAALPAAADAGRDLRRLRRCATPVSIAIEGTGLEDARAKLYLRLVSPAALADLDVAPLGHPALAAFLQDVLEDRPIPGSGLNLAIGWSLATGALTDAKIDLCAHCLPRPAAEWAALARRATARCGLRPLALDEASTSGRVSLALIGLGVDCRGEARVNAYVRAA